MIRIVCHHLLALLVSLICVRCATVSSPTGGLRDEAAPILLESSVSNGSTNFTEKSIILTFNEFVKLNNPSQNVYSSPPLGPSVSYVTKKNKLFIIFKEALEENTTYHLNFGKSIQDVNESNPMSNYQFVFATGDAIDSLAYQGRIQSINNAEITENTLVGLYKESEDSAFLKHPPFYFTYVEDNGNFLLDYLKAGEYRVFALTDRNNNYFYDLPNEAIGFLDSSLVLDQNLFLADIPLFVPEETDLRVKSFTTTISNYKVDHELSRSIPVSDSFSIEFWSDSISLLSFSELSDDRKIISSWIGTELKNKNSIYSIVKWNGNLIDTFQHSISQLAFPKLEISYSTLKMTSKDSLIISLSNPMFTPCLNIAIIDTLNNENLSAITRKVSDFQLVTNLPGPGRTDVVYTLLTADSCITDIYGQYLRNPSQNLQFESDEERGTLHLTFEEFDSTMNYLVSLQDAQRKTILTKSVDENNFLWIIENIKSGNYLIQIIEDTDSNGVWNSGSLIPRKHPERIYTYGKEFIIRPNWELEESVNLSAP